MYPPDLLIASLQWSLPLSENARLVYRPRAYLPTETEHQFLHVVPLLPICTTEQFALRSSLVCRHSQADDAGFPFFLPPSACFLACFGLVWSDPIRLHCLQQVKALNEGGDFPSNAEVVVAPPSIFLQTVKDSIRPDIKASAFLYSLLTIAIVQGIGEV